MRRRVGPVAAIIVALSTVGATTTQVAATTTQPGTPESNVLGLNDPGRVAGQYIVLLDRGVDAEVAADEAERVHGVDVGDVYDAALHGYSVDMTPREAELVAQSAGVSAVHVDTRVQLTAQAMPTGVNRANADASPTAAINNRDQRVNADVAVIDTGVDLNHPDLNVNRAGAHTCARGRPSPNDQNGHGTHVAGTIAALDNNIGVVGMAPGARVWPVRVLGPSGSGTMAEVICGIDYVTRHAGQIEVANMSLGGFGSDDGNCGRTAVDPLHQAVCASVRAGVTYVVAAGNSSADSATSVPGAYDEVITVSALADFNGRPGGGARATCRRDVDDTFADFSNFGADVDLIAPGVCIRSTWRNGRYEILSGTSMASPHVAGGAALYVARHPAAGPARVRSALRAAGTATWNDGDDPDGTQEPLLDVSGF